MDEKVLKEVKALYVSMSPAERREVFRRFFHPEMNTLPGSCEPDGTDQSGFGLVR